VLDWIHLALDRDQSVALANAMMNLRDPQNVGKIDGFSRRTQLHTVSYLKLNVINSYDPNVTRHDGVRKLLCTQNAAC
jgi:hypothetical protein